MARSLQDVLAEVTKQSDPQRQLVLKQISDIPTQQQADEAGLEAQKNQGFNDIMLGARRRGVAYWGAPIAEQQSYLSTDFLPAVAKMKQGYNDKATSLESALANIGQQDYATANDIFNQDRTFEENQRQFNANLELQRQQIAAQNAAANAASYLNPPQSPQPSASGGPAVPQGLQQLYNQVFLKSNGSSWSDKDLVSDYNATLRGAKNGNMRDKQKLELYHSVRPDLFGTSVPIAVLSNSNQLRY